MKQAIAALAAACALWGAPTSAAKMQATIVGDYNDDPYWLNWQVDIFYDTDFGFLNTTGPDANELFGTSMVSLVTGFIVPRPPSWGGWWAPPDFPTSPYTFSFTDANQAYFARSSTYDTFMVSGPGWSLELGDFWSSFNEPHPTDGRFDTSWSRNIYEYGTLDVGAPHNSGRWAHTHGLLQVKVLDPEVQPNAVPEPAAWALMILGLGLAGATIRRRHAVMRAGVPAR